MKNFPISLLALVFVVIGCGNSTKVATGPTNINTSSATTADSSQEPRRVQVNQTKEFGGLQITLGEIAMEKGKITVGMTIINPTKETKTFYPNQGELVIGSTQMSSNAFLDSGDTSGEIHAGVEKRGSIAFIDENKTVDPATVKQIKFKFGKVYGENIMRSVDADWDLAL